jgi:hypothetical protein
MRLYFVRYTNIKLLNAEIERCCKIFIYVQHQKTNKENYKIHCRKKTIIHSSKEDMQLLQISIKIKKDEFNIRI